MAAILRVRPLGCKHQQFVTPLRVVPLEVPYRLYRTGGSVGEWYVMLKIELGK